MFPGNGGNEHHNHAHFTGGTKRAMPTTFPFSEARSDLLDYIPTVTQKERQRANYTTTSFMMFPMLLERSGMRT